MLRRTALKSLIASFTGATVASRAVAEPSLKSKVVYHLSDFEKVSFVLGNIRNHYDGMNGPENVEIALVIHGPPLRAFRSDGAFGNIRSDLAGLQRKGLMVFACQRTMDGMGLKLADLLPGFQAAEKGGVVKLATFQAEGYAYLRP
jgi:intracellular sulfur oxidation DsrE/DsrF family protein